MTVTDLWTIQIVDDNAEDGGALSHVWTRNLMREAEENLTDLLPAGYRAHIRRWDHPDEDEGTPSE